MGALMTLKPFYTLAAAFLVSACVMKKSSDTLWQTVGDSGVNYPQEAVSDLGLSEEIVKKVYSKENLLQAQTQLQSGKSFELNVLLRDDWQTRLPMRLKSGSMRTYDDIDSLDEVTGLGDLIIKGLKINATSADSIRRATSGSKPPAFDLLKIEITKNTLPELILALNALHKLPSVLIAEPNFKVNKIAIPNDPSFPSLWGMTKISAPQVWDVHTGSSSVVVAVIDTGVDVNHPDLKDNIWKNTREIPGNGVDDDGNGYIDDVNGWDFAYGDNDPSDGDGHGTHCAGTVAARGNNGIGVAGVNWVSRIMPVKVLDDSGSGYNYDIYSGLIYAVSNGAKVTSNSYGGGGASSLMASAIKAAQDAGVFFVAAAGNESASKASYPAYYTKTYSNVLSVASTETNDSLSSFSNYSDGVDVAAPGRNILSTAPGNQYVTLSGTSMATPHVAGVAALLWSAAPSKTLSEIRSAIRNSSDSVPALAGKVAAGGRVNVKAALDALGGVTAPTPTPTVTASPTAAPTASPTATPDPNPSVTPTAGPEPTATPSPTVTPTPTPTPEPTPTPTPTPSYGEGLRFRTYRGFWIRLPNFDSLRPAQEGTTNSVTLGVTQFQSQFGAVFEGLIWIPSSGEYTFFVRSDDGSALKIDGERVVNNDGLHGLRERSGSRVLSQGFHSFRLEYFQLLGGRGLSMQWQGPGVTRRKLEGRGVFFHNRVP